MERILPLLCIVALTACSSPVGSPDTGADAVDAGCDVCVSGTTQCNGNAVETCQMGSNGCFEWGALTACGAFLQCQSGSCQAQCRDACTPSTAQCVGNAVETCQIGSDGCLEWSAPATCEDGQTCMSGACTPSCTDACTANATQCVANAVEACQTGADGCLEWSTPADCGDQAVCSDGACIPTCNGVICSSDAICVTSASGSVQMCAVVCNDQSSTAAQCTNDAPCCAPVEGGTTAACVPLAFAQGNNASCECFDDTDCTSAGVSSTNPSCAPYATNDVATGPYLCKPNDAAAWDGCSGITEICPGGYDCWTSPSPEENEFCAHSCNDSSMCGSGAECVMGGKCSNDLTSCNGNGFCGPAE